MPNFLPIENKEDTPEKLAAAAGKPTKNFLFAGDVNTIKDRINLIWELLILNSSELINSSNKIELGLIYDPFIQALNEGELRNVASPAFITYQLGDVFYTQAFVGAAGEYGDGSGQFTEDDFVLLEQSESAPPPTPSSKEFYAKLTQVGTANPTYTDAFNNLGFEPVFVRDNLGAYKLTIPNTLKNKVFVFFGSVSALDHFDGKILYILNQSDENVLLTVRTYNQNTLNMQDNLLYETCIHIKIFD